MRVYKVVRKIDTKYYSLLAHRNCVEYKVEEWVEPKIKNSALMAYSTLSCATKDVAGREDELTVLECEAIQFNGSRPRDRLHAWYLDIGNAVERFWNESAFRWDWLAEWPTNTAFCSAIKPLRIL